MLTDYNQYTAFIAVMTVVIALIIILSLLIYVWSSLALMAVFKKARHPQPWAAWVPYFRDFAFLEVGGQSGWFMFLGLAASFSTSLAAETVGFRFGVTSLLAFTVSAAYLVIWIFAIANVNRAFGKNVLGFTIFGVLLPVIWLSVLAWDKSRFAPAKANGIMLPGRGQTFLEQSKIETPRFAEEKV